MNPDNDTLKKYEAAVAEYNKTQLKPNDKFQMKACHLCLNYRAAGDVRVMQSSRYIYGKDSTTVSKM